MTVRVYWTAESLSSLSTTATSRSSSATLTFTPDAGSTDYVLFWSCELQSNSTSVSALSWVRDDTAATDLAAYTMEAKENASPIDWLPMAGFRKWMSPSTPVSQTFIVQFAAETAGTTAAVRNARLVVLKLGANDVYGESLTPSTWTAATQDTKLSLTVTPPSSGDYLVLGYTRHLCSSVATQQNVGLYSPVTGFYYPDRTSSLVATNGNYPKDPTDVHTFVGSVVDTLSAATTYRIDAIGSSSSSRTLYEAAILALRLSDFDAAYSAESTTDSSNTSTTYSAAAALTQTTSANPHLILATYKHQSTSSTVSAYSAVRVDGAAAIEPVTERGSSSANGFLWPGLFSVVTPTAASHTFDIAHKSETSGTASTLAAGSRVSVLDLGSAGGSYSLSAAGGSVSLSGQASGLLATRTLPAAQGSLGVSGQNAALASSSPLSAWYAAVAAVNAGTRNARLLALGDSLTAGYNSQNSGWGGNAKAYSYPTVLAGLLTGATCSTASFLGDQGSDTATALASYDTRLGFGTGWGPYAGVHTVGGLWHTQAGGSTTDLTFAPGVSFDRFDVIYARYASTYEYTVNIGGATLATLDMVGSPDAILTDTVSCSAGTNTIHIHATGDAGFVAGVIAYTSSVKTIQVLNGGWSGATAADFAASGNFYDPLNVLGALAPDLTIIMLGANDAYYGTSEASFKASLGAIVDKAKLSGSVLLVSSHYIDPAYWTTTTAQTAVMTWISDVATSKGVRYLRLADRANWGTAAAAAAAGYISNDNIHLSATGYADLAAAIAGVLNVSAAAYSLTSAQGSFTLTGQAAGLLTARVLPSSQGSFALSGQAAGLLLGAAVGAGYGAFSMAGQDATLSKTGAASFTLTSDYASVSLSGQDAGLLAARALGAGYGGVAFTGQDATLTKTGSYSLLADYAPISLAGQSAGLLAARVLAMAQGALALSGQAAGLLAARAVSAAQGAFTLTGQDAAVRGGLKAVADYGTFNLSGQDAAFVRARYLVAAVGGFDLTGQAAAFRVTYALTSEYGSYGLTGFSAALTDSGAEFWTPISATPETWLSEASVGQSWLKVPSISEIWNPQ